MNYLAYCVPGARVAAVHDDGDTYCTDCRAPEAYPEAPVTFASDNDGEASEPCHQCGRAICLLCGQANRNANEPCWNCGSELTRAEE